MYKITGMNIKIVQVNDIRSAQTDRGRSTTKEPNYRHSEKKLLKSLNNDPGENVNVPRKTVYANNSYVGYKDIHNVLYKTIDHDMNKGIFTFSNRIYSTIEL